MSGPVSIYDQTVDPPVPIGVAANPLPVTLTGTGTGTSQVVGNVASGAADSGNPVKAGGVFTSGSIPSSATGQRTNFQTDDYGNLRVRITGATSAPQTGLTQVTYCQLPSSGSTSTGALASFAVTNHNWDGTNIKASPGDVNGTIVQSALITARTTYNTGTSGILANTTTAVTMFAAAGVSVRNYLKTLVINTTAFGAAVPLAIRDGAGGTVLWCGLVPTGGWLTPVTLAFDPPLKGTANTLMEIVTTTANTTGTVYGTAQGFQGT